MIPKRSRAAHTDADQRSMAGERLERKGRSRFTRSYDRESLKHCLADMDPYLGLVERPAVSRRVRLRA